MDRHNKRRLVSVATDLLMVATGWFCFNILRYYTLPSETVDSHVSLASFLLSRTLVIEQLVVPPAIIVLYAISGAYNRSNTMYRSRLDELINTFTVSPFRYVIEFPIKRCTIKSIKNVRIFLHL